MKKDYILDGKEITYQDVIIKAQEYGYGEETGIMFTSEACRVLENNGHSIQCVRESSYKKGGSE